MEREVREEGGEGGLCLVSCLSPFFNFFMSSYSSPWSYGG